jgi:probable rRNA maturation factor
MRRARRERRPAPARAPAIDIIVASPLWRGARGAKALLRRAIRAAAAMAGACGELAVLLVDDRAIRALNRTWRGKDKATNVLAFPARRMLPGAPMASRRGAPIRPLGDVVIAFETVRREADAAQLPFGHHLAHLAVHGFLHLVGYDHAAAAQAEAMEALEVAILSRLDVPDPYAAPPAEPDC